MHEKTVIVRLSEELHRAFKVKCAQEGENMNSVLTAMIESYVKDPAKRAKKQK
jgi:predicted HicB family RNase H-like nuclease